MSTKHVNIDGRKFVVVRNAKGEALRIRERKLYAPGKPWEAWYDAPYWSAAHHKLPDKPTSLIVRILAAG